MYIYIYIETCVCVCVCLDTLVFFFTMNGTLVSQTYDIFLYDNCFYHYQLVFSVSRDQALDILLLMPNFANPYPKAHEEESPIKSKAQILLYKR